MPEKFRSTAILLIAIPRSSCSLMPSLKPKPALRARSRVEHRRPPRRPRCPRDRQPGKASPQPQTRKTSRSPRTARTRPSRLVEDHTAATPQLDCSPRYAETSLPVGTYSNRPILQSNIWNVILVDLLNTPAAGPDLSPAHALRTFASQLPAGPPVALLVMSAPR